MGSQIVQIACLILLLSAFSIHICYGLSASHQHQVTYSESDDESHYGYRSSPASVSYDDDDFYGAEESSSGPRVITGSGRMTILDKRSSQEASKKDQQEIVSKSKSANNEQQQHQHQHQHQQPNGQNNHSMAPAITNYHVEWTESIDHGPSKSSSKSASPSTQPQMFQNQMQPQFPVNNGYSAYPPRSSSPYASGSHEEYADTRPMGNNNYRGQPFNEPYVGYSESQIDSEWEFPDFMKEQKNQDDKYHEDRHHEDKQYEDKQDDKNQYNNDQHSNDQYNNDQYDDNQYGNNQYDNNQHSDDNKHYEDKQYDDKYYEDKPAEGKLESPEQIGRRPGYSKDKSGKGGLLESYFWKALP